MRVSPLVWIAGAAVAVYFISKASISKKATFVLKSIKPGGKLFSPKIDVEVSVLNPTNGEATLKSLVGEIFINGNFIANLSSFGNQKISANSESVLKFTATPVGLSVFQTLVQLFRDRDKNIIAQLKGTANVDGLSIAIDNSAKII